MGIMVFIKYSKKEKWMTLQERIYQDILSPDINKEEKGILKLVKSDIQRERNKEVPDNIVIKILKAHVSGATECIKYLSIEDVDRYNNCVLCIKTLEEYLPRMVSDDEIKQYIIDNIETF